MVLQPDVEMKEGEVPDSSSSSSDEDEVQIGEEEKKEAEKEAIEGNEEHKQQD